MDGARGEAEGADVALAFDLIDYAEDDVDWEVGRCDHPGWLVWVRVSGPRNLLGWEGRRGVSERSGGVLGC